MKDEIKDILLTNLCYLDYQYHIVTDEKAKAKIKEMIEIVEGSLRRHLWEKDPDIVYEI